MGESTAIAWTDRTWNPWRGCTKISPGCDNCYMFRQQRKSGLDPEVVTRTKTWGDPAKWQKAAAAAGRTERIFTCSWSDWFHPAADGFRAEAWATIAATPNLTYQILTKRARRMALGYADGTLFPSNWLDGYQNVWLGVSVESPDYIERIDYLQKVPAAVRFLSVEPLIKRLPDNLDLWGIDWVIVGGESGQGFRPMPHEWASAIEAQCREQGVAFFFKQSAAYRTEMGIELNGRVVREYPTPRQVYGGPRAVGHLSL